jgi:hypothetical protein
MLAEARRSVLLVIVSRALPVGPLLSKHADGLSMEMDILGQRSNPVSRSSEMQLEIGDKAGHRRRNKLDVGVRNAFKEVSMGRTLKTISSG